MLHRDYVLLVVMLVLLALPGCLNQGIDVTKTAENQSINVLLTQEEKTKITDVLKLLLAVNGQQGEPVIKEVSQENGLIKVMISIDGNEAPVYLTPDKQKIILSQPLSIDELKQTLTQQYERMKEMQTAREEGKEISYIIDIEKGHKKGNGDIIVIEFSDFQCPFCKRFFDQSLGQLEQNFIETGKITFVYKHFPLKSIHPMAEAAAIAAECAADQGKFWEYHDELFRRQSEWSVDSNVFYDIANKLGLDEQQFKECFDNKEKKNVVDEQLQQGMTYGLSGTPSFFIKVPKSKYSLEEVKGAFSVVLSIDNNAEFLIEDEYYVLKFSGAYPYQLFESLLNKLDK